MKQMSKFVNIFWNRNLQCKNRYKYKRAKKNTLIFNVTLDIK